MAMKMIQLIVGVGFTVAIFLIVLNALLGATSGQAATAINETITGLANIPAQFATIGTLVGILILVYVAAPMLGGLFGKK
jgi:uncharacterized protein YacL